MKNGEILVHTHETRRAVCGVVWLAYVCNTFADAETAVAECWVRQVDSCYAN